MGLHESTWSGGSLAVGEWTGSNDVKTGLVSPLACISFSIAGEEKNQRVLQSSFLISLQPHCMHQLYQKSE